MLTLSSQEYKEDIIRAEERLKGGNGCPGDRDTLKIKKQCVKVLKKVEAATGLSFDVVTDKDSDSQNMAACVDFTLNKVFISEETLAANDNNWAIYAGRHEKEHLASGVKSFDVTKDLSSDHQNALQEVLKGQDLETDAMEGFNDLSTIKRYGKHKKSGYLKKEVPFAEQLEEVCKKETGYSLLETYRSGNAPLLNYRVRKLADKVLCKQAFDELKKEKIAIINWRKFSTLEKQLNSEQPAVSNFDQARQTVQKLFADQNQIDTIRAKLAA